ncbi:MAG: DUF2130 domain-containing protein [Erysipelotrichaceae bacterium]|nr:DUF2130 domain-containing protein [Erysipelotrichaceae bacterium]
MKQIQCPNCGKVFTIDENDYASIVKQIKDGEYKEDLKRLEDRLHREKEDALKVQELKDRENYTKELNARDNRINELMARLENKDNEARLYTANEVAKIKEEVLKREDEIKELSFRLSQKDNEAELKLNKAVALKEQEISELKAGKAAADDLHRKELKAKDEEIAYYKDFKARQSTKMIGEDLEQHCLYEFNRLRPLFRNAYFEKDNDASAGSKGDFIFRDCDEDGTEIVSIMFEMKNEADETATKHRNEDFLAKLDKDRKQKNCEYAVLVSLLEMDNDTYNEGIVDMSHRYPKMYVVRPQNFISIITLLRKANLNSLDYKKQLMVARSQDIDLSHFEENINAFKDAFGKNYELASRKFNTAIEEIDKSIDHLNKIKEALTSSDRQLRLANDKAQDLSVRRLTKNAPSIAEKLKG